MLVTQFTSGPFQTNCYLLVNEESGEAVAVDTGMGTFAPVSAYAAQEGLTLVAILLTHGHIDHTRDAGKFSVPVYIHPDDAFMLDHGKGLSPKTLQLFDAEHMEQVKDVRFVDDGEELHVGGICLKVLHAPGHSPGCVMYEAEEFVLSGDVLFRGAIGRTDLPYSNEASMVRSLRGPVWELDDALTVLPGHGPATAMVVERRSNPFLLQANRGR